MDFKHHLIIGTLIALLTVVTAGTLYVTSILNAEERSDINSTLSDTTNAISSPSKTSDSLSGSDSSGSGGTSGSRNDESTNDETDSTTSGPPHPEPLPPTTIHEQTATEPPELPPPDSSGNAESRKKPPTLTPAKRLQETGEAFNMFLKEIERAKKLEEKEAQKLVAQEKKKFEQRHGAKVYRDTDNDGVSDYDEEFIYKTNPRNAYTSKSALKDGERIFGGLDPLTATATPITYEEPHQVSTILPTLAVIDAIPETVTPQETTTIKGIVRLRGRALPNSIITLYIYSTPVIVTVKADEHGDWTYILEKELEDGDHEVYAAVVNNSGKIIARSEPLPFVKRASAATLDQVDILKSEETGGGFLRRYFLWITGGIVILGIVITLVVIGLMNRNKEDPNGLPLR